MSIGGTIVDDATQEVVGYLAGSDELVEANVGAGQTFVPGPYEPAALYGHRVPPPPEPARDYLWNDSQWRWQLTSEAEDLRIRAESARAQIAALETRQARPLRELVLGLGDSDELRSQLADIDKRIEQLRRILAAPGG